MPATRDLVVAFYNENLSWLHHPLWRTFDRIWVYDKSTRRQPHFLPLNSKVVYLNNLGLDWGTHLWHICDHYEQGDLADITYFLQGNPFDHCPDVLDLVANNASTNSYIELSNLFPVCNADGAPEHPGLPLPGMWEMTFGKPWPGPDFTIEFVTGSQYGVTRGRITQWPLAFWARMRNFVLLHPLGPWLVERMAREIFRIQLQESTSG